MGIETASTHARKHWVRPLRVKNKKKKRKKERKKKRKKKEKKEKRKKEKKRKLSIVLNDRDFICAGVSWSKTNAS